MPVRISPGADCSCDPNIADTCNRIESGKGNMDRVWFRSYDPRVPHSVEYPDECLPVLVDRIAAKQPQNTATEFYGARLTYAEFWEHVKRFAHALNSLGVGRNTRVAIMLPNCPQAVIAYYAILWLGAAVVMTNPLYVERELEHQWGDAEAEVAVVLDHLFPKVEKVIPQTKVRTVIVTSMREYFPLHFKWLYPIRAWQKKLFTAVPYDGSILNFTKLIRSSPPWNRPFAASLDDVAMLQYTGGTTGVIKGVVLSHRNILANVAQLAAWFPDIRWGGERFLALLPFFHVFGMTVSMNLPLFAGCTLILLPRFEVKELIRTVQKGKPTVFPGVPSIYTAIVNHPEIRNFDVSSIRFCVTGSAPMPLEVLRNFESLTGSVIVEGFGLTEASPVTHANPIVGVRKPGSIGLALPNTDCRIVDLETGERVLPAGEIGELTVKGPQVMQSYWKMEGETAFALRDGWLYTGDIAKMDENGYVFIVDRKKDLIISKGYNIYPREIDEVLYEHPGVQDAVAVGVPDPKRGESVKVIIVPKPKETITEEEIIRFCKARLAAYKVPRSVEFRDSLPKTVVGKISRHELRRETIAKAE